MEQNEAAIHKKHVVSMNMSMWLLQAGKGTRLAWSKPPLPAAHSGSSALKSDPAVVPPLAAAPQRVRMFKSSVFSTAQHKAPSSQGSQEGLLA